MKKKIKAFYGLPKKILFCKKTLMSNQRPCSTIEFKHTPKEKKKTIKFDKRGISDSWHYSRKKKFINYEKREKELLKLLEKHRGKHGEYDCIVPGSGGKDSCFAAHVLKYKYGMNPLTVTFPPVLYTKYGENNYKNWIKSINTRNIKANYNIDVMRFLTTKAVKNLLHPFQTFILGQKNFPIKVALKKKIPLVFYGENEAEHGNAIADNDISLRNKSYFTYKKIDKLFFAGVKYKDLINEHKIRHKDLDYLFPANYYQLEKNKIEVHYLGYYLKWVPQEVYYYSVENCNFRPRPFRTQGTYSKYNSIDDKIDDIHYYTTFIKFGIGRATYDVSQEIRNDHISIEEGKKLIKKYDGEYPSRYMKDICTYLKISESEFNAICDKFRSPHLWVKKNKKIWTLRHTANHDGCND